MHFSKLFFAILSLAVAAFGCTKPEPPSPESASQQAAWKKFGECYALSKSCRSISELISAHPEYCHTKDGLQLCSMFIESQPLGRNPRAYLYRASVLIQNQECVADWDFLHYDKDRRKNNATPNLNFVWIREPNKHAEFMKAARSAKGPGFVHNGITYSRTLAEAGVPEPLARINENTKNLGVRAFNTPNPVVPFNPSSTEMTDSIFLDECKARVNEQ